VDCEVGDVMKLNKELNIGVLMLVMAIATMSLMFVLKDFWQLFYVVGLVMFLSGAILMLVGSIELLVKVVKTIHL